MARVHDPFKQPASASDDADEFDGPVVHNPAVSSAAASSVSPSSSRGAATAAAAASASAPALPVGYRRPPNPWGETMSPRKWFNSFLPDTRSQVAFILALMCALAGSIVWLVFTVRDKWIADIENPQQVVTYEVASSLPAMFGLLLAYYDPYVPPSSVLYRRVALEFTQNLRNRSFTNEYVTCQDTFLSVHLTFCQPARANGDPYFHTFPGELDGSSQLHDATQISLNDWPLQFMGNTDALCVNAYSLVNASLLVGTPTFGVPFLGVIPLQGQRSAVSFLEYLAANLTSAMEAAPFVFSVPNPQVLLYNAGHSLTFSTTKIIGVDGSERLEYDYGVGRDFSYSASVVEIQFDSVIAATVAENQIALADQMRAWRNASDVRFLFNQVCFSPSSFNVRVVRAVRSYGVTSFLSDVGGFLNLLTVVLLAFFPFAHKLTEPRSFIAIWFADRWRQKQQRQHAKQLAQLPSSTAASAAAGAEMMPRGTNKPSDSAQL